MQVSLLFSRATPSAIVSLLQEHGAVPDHSGEGTAWAYPAANTPLVEFALRSDIAGSGPLCVGTIQEWYFELADPVRTWIPFEQQLGVRPTVFVVGTLAQRSDQGIAELGRFLAALLTAHDGILSYRDSICTSEEVRSQGQGALPFMEDLTTD